MLLTVLLLGVGVAAVVYNFVTPAKLSIQRDKQNAAVLAQAKAALIGFAAGVALAGAARPGDLPCPDRDNDGDADAVPICNTAALSLGRLPWRTLGLPDLRDSDGERLWYAVSINFRNNPRTPCANPGDAGCLNSDARGTITVRRSDGTILHDGTNPDAWTPSGVIAVVFAPGEVLRRLGAGASQDRSAAGVNNPVNYLDIDATGEDNAVFADGTTNGFIQGPLYDAAGNIVINDRMITITYQDLMPLLQRRVAKEALNCLTAYASQPQNGGPANGRYPWAAPVTDTTPPYSDVVNTRFGRIPDGPFGATLLGIGGAIALAVCPLTPALCMQNTWPGTCTLTGAWWINWKDQVFYGVADAYKPADPVSALLGVPASGGCGSCLSVNPPSATADKRVVVAVAGKRLSAAAYPTGADQPRATAANRSDATNYLEGTNDNSATSNTYEQQPISASFSDFLLYQ